MKHKRSFSNAPSRLARALFGLALTALAWAAPAPRAFAADYTVTTTGNAIVVTDVAGNGDMLDVTEPSAGNIQFAAPGRTFSVDGGAPISGDSGVLSRSGVTQITVNAGAGADAIYIRDFTGTLPSLTVNGGTGDDSVTFDGDITFAANAALDVDLQNDDASPGADVVYVWANVLVSGSGTITVKCSKNVSVSSEASLQTVNGNLTVEANQQAVPTPGVFTGVLVDGLVRCTGTGQVLVRGRGGDSAGGYQLGVLAWSGGQIIGGTSGAVTVMGTGGASTNIVNRGVTIYGTGALISSLGGPVQVTGQAGSVGSDYGIGIAILYGGVISAGGSGTVTVTGTGAGGGGFNQGIELSEPGSAIYSGGGAIHATGIAGPGSSFGLYVENQASIINTNVGDSIRLIADSISLATNVSLIAGGSVTLQPENMGTLINLGGADTGGTLGLTDEELDLITASTLVIGGTNAGSITVSAPISPANTAALTLVSGDAIGDSHTGGADVTVTSLTTSGNLAPGASPGIFSVAGDETLAANSTFTVEIGGTTAGTQHDQLSASGSVTIGANVTLNTLNFGGFMPGFGQSFMIISRTGGSGAFAGLPEGATLANFLGTGLGATISYTGGTGEDVVLAMLAPEIVVEQPSGTELADSVVIAQYASTVLGFSSAFGGVDGGWGANQILGEPNTFAYGDYDTSWSARTADGTLDFITAGFATPVYATGATVRETWANGFVYQIDVVDTNDGLHTVWTGTDPSPPGSPVNFESAWARTPYLVKGLKVYVDTDHVIGEWEEIDSIQLHGVTSRAVNFGAVKTTRNTNLTFTIRNTGNTDLTGLGITIDGAAPGDFAVTASPTAPVSAPSGSTTFTVRFTPAAGGARDAVLHIANNDSDENPFDIVLTGLGIPRVAIVANGATLGSESCGAGNGRIDPNEIVTVNFSLGNVGFGNADAVTATLESTGGVLAPSGPQSYGTLSRIASAARPFTFTANAPCAGSITATLQIQTNGTAYGTVTYDIPVGITTTNMSENFDAVTIPALPAGWTSSASAGMSPWITSSEESDSPTNAAFSPNSGSAGMNALVSPIIAIQSASARLTFHQIYDLDYGFDGGVLEIKVGAGAFQDILAAGGTFDRGGYTTTLMTNTSNPLAGREAWSGGLGSGGFGEGSPGFIQTTVNLPPAAAGQSIQLRWLRGTHSEVSSSGWYVDTIAIEEMICCNPPPALTDHLIGYWNFDEGAGLTLLDQSGYGNNGGLQNFPGNNSQWVTGWIGGALNFGGPDFQNWVYVTNYPKATTTMTLSAWALAESRPLWASIAKNWGGRPVGFTGQFHLGLKEFDGILHNQQTENDGGIFSANEDGGTLFPLGTWQHVAFVCDGSEMRLYRNGVQVASTPYDGTILNAPVMTSLAIGCKTGDSGLAPDSFVPGFWHGRIDDLALWRRALAPEEIHAIFAAGANGSPLLAAIVGAVPPSILEQPVGTNAPTGTEVTLCVTVTGSPIPSLFQWRRNGVNIPGATNSCFTILAAQPRDGGTFDVVVENSSGAVVSESASVVIAVPMLPPGDNLANRVPLSGASGTVGGSNFNATHEPGEPMHVGKPGGASVWYSFTSDVAGIMSIDTAGSTFDTLLAVYTGATIPALVEVASDEESGGALTSEVRFNVAPRFQYDIVVDGYGGIMGDFVISWDFQQTAQLYPVILVQPESITVPPGASHIFTATVTGTGLAYQWYVNGNPVPGATTNSLTLTDIQESALGTYVLRVTQGALSLDSRPVSLQLNLTGGFTQPVQATDKLLDADLLANPILLGNTEYPPAPIAPASIIRGYTGTQTFNTYGSANAVGEPPICRVRGGASTWIKLVAEQSGELHINTDGSSFNTVVEVFERIPGVANLHSLGCDDTNGLDRLDSALVVPVVAGRTNFIEIDGVNGAIGLLKFNYNLVVPSSLTPLGPNGAGQFQFLVTGRPGMSFSIQYTTNFRTWVNLFSGTDADGSFLFTDTSTVAPGGRIYRLRMLP